MNTPWLLLITAAVMGAVVVAAITMRQVSPRVVDILLIAIAVVAVTLQMLWQRRVDDDAGPEHFVTGSGTGREDREHFVDASVPTTTAKEGFERMPSGVYEYMTVYTSSLDERSYADGFGKTWKNVAMRASIPTRQCEADGSVRDANFLFRTTPAFSRKDGFPLGTNTLTGPYSHQLGLKADQALSVFFVTRITGDVPSTGREPLSFFRIFANTVGNNGLSLSLRNGSRVNDMVRAEVVLELGNLSGIVGTRAVVLDPRHRYLWVVVKDYGRLKVLAVDLDADAYEKSVYIDTSVGAHDSILFSNVDMTINGNGNWNGNIIAFGASNRAMSDVDTTALFDHYKAAFRAYDPEYVALQKKLGEADALRSCPYDKLTCSVCSGVRDWTNTSEVIASGRPCLTQIDAFCSANPQHTRCTCWNSTNPDYNTTCRAYRAIFNGVLLGDASRKDGKDSSSSSSSSSDDEAGKPSKHRSVADIEAVIRLVNAMKSGGGAERQSRSRPPVEPPHRIGARPPVEHCYADSDEDKDYDGDRDSSDEEEEEDAGERRIHERRKVAEGEQLQQRMQQERDDETRSRRRTDDQPAEKRGFWDKLFSWD
jgi:hypothetical protein